MHFNPDHSRGDFSLTPNQTSAVLALTEVRSEDKAEFAKLLSAVKEGYTDKYEEARRHWGGGIMGPKANARTEKKRKAAEAAIKV